MSNITPVNIEYISEIGDHILKAEVEHLELARRFSFYFDDKLVSEKAVGPGEFFTDDDCISDMVKNYCQNNKGVLSDLFANHADKVHLVEKNLEFVIEHYGIKMKAYVVEEKEQYKISVKAENNVDEFSCTIKACNFSEVLEKVRIFTSTLANISDNFSSNIDELANDKVEAWIKWE